jgi:hypothetical protein
MSSIEIDSDAVSGNFARMLEQHKAAIQNAERRKGERPVDMPSWGELVAEYGMTLIGRNLENLG